MLRWKIFAVLSILIELAWWGSVFWGEVSFEAVDAFGAPIDLIGLAGLITFAFALPSMSQRFWRLFHPIYIAWVTIELTRAAMQDAISVATLVGVAVALMVAGFNWLALYRLAGSPWSRRLKRAV